MEALYLKYRPKTFDDIIGQSEIVSTLVNSIKANKISHSYLFYGPRGCGKTSTARILAKVLNCKKPKLANPCNECVSCVEISQSSSIDVMEIDAASHTQVQNVRDVIINSASLSPARDKYKIYILDEVHMLSTSAFNALLKTIEEPPSHVVFILATTEVSKVPITIVSRCQTFRFKLLPEDVITRHLKDICSKENIEYEEQAIRFIAKASTGAVRDAIVLLEKIVSFSGGKITLKNARVILGLPEENVVKKLAYAVIERNIKSIHEAFDIIKKEGYEPISVLRELRDVFSKTFLKLNSLYDGDDVIIPDGDFNQFLFPRLARKLNKIIDELKFSENPVLLGEVFLYTLIDSVDIEGLIKKIGQYYAGSVEKTSDSEKKEVESTKPSTKNESSNLDITALWRKILANFLNTNYQVYNILLSSDMKFHEGKLHISVNTDIEKELLLKYVDEIKKIVSEYSIDLVIGLKKTIDDEEVFFPEFEKIKKVFGEHVVRVIKNEVSSKTDR